MGFSTLVRNIYNVLFNRSGNGNAGGVYPTAAISVIVTGGKVWAYGAWAELVAAAAMAAECWITDLFVGTFTVTGGDEHMVELGTGAGGGEVALTGSQKRVYDIQVSDVGHVAGVDLPYHFPLYIPTGTRIAARMANNANANNTAVVAVGYRTALGT